jgi:hypothetical protein
MREECLGSAVELVGDLRPALGALADCGADERERERDPPGRGQDPVARGGKLAEAGQSAEQRAGGRVG